MGYFVIITRANSFYYFQYKTDTGAALLTSEGYTSKLGCLAGIESTKIYSKDVSRYIRMRSAGGDSYFMLKAANGQILAMSERYNNESKLNDAISFIKQNALDAQVSDTTSLVIAK